MHIKPRRAGRVILEGHVTAIDATGASHDHAPNAVGASVKERNPQRTVAIVVLLVALLLFAVVISWSGAPLLPRRLPPAAYVVGIGPEVSGRVIEVGVTDYSREARQDAVSPGPGTVQACRCGAEARLAGVGQTIGAWTAAVDVAQTRVVETKAIRDNVQDHSARALELVRRGIYVQAKFDEAAAAAGLVEASVVAAEATSRRLRRSLDLLERTIRS